MSEHITSPKVYITIFLALMVLTALTILVAFQNLGPFNDIAALGIAIRVEIAIQTATQRCI